LASPSTPVPTNPINIRIRLSSPAPARMDGTLELSFRPNATAVSPVYRDPALQFAAGGTTLAFTIQQGETTASLPQDGALQQGTVAGDIMVILTRFEMSGASVLPTSSIAATATMARIPPVITPRSVRITDVTREGFVVQLTGYSTGRDLDSVHFTFLSAPGAHLSGTLSGLLPLSSPATAWFDSEEGLRNGSRFSLRIPFGFSGSPEALGRVTITLSNTAGTSEAVSSVQ
jgi:hypothetical protein